MEKRVIDYILDFINEEYSLYYNEIVDAKYYMTIISYLEKNRYRGNDICNGDTDNIIKDMIDDYIKKNLSNIMNQYNSIYSDIKRIVLSKNNFLSYSINEDILDVVVDEITNNIMMNRGKKQAFYIDNLDKKYILQQIDSYSNRFYMFTRNYVREELYNNVTFNSLSLNCKEYFLDYVNTIMLERYNVKKIIEGELNQIINTTFLELYDRTRRDVLNYINGVLSEINYDISLYRDEVINYVFDRVFTIGSFEIEDLYKGTYDSLILGVIKSKNSARSDGNLIYEHIYNRIKQLDSLNLSNDDLNNIAWSMYNDLTYKYGKNRMAILDEKNDEEIARLFQIKVMRYNSVEDLQKPKKIAYKTSVKKLKQPLVTLLKIAVIGMIAVIAVTSSYEIVDNIRDASAYSELMDYENFEYSVMYSKDNENVGPTAEHAVDFYNQALSLKTEDTNYGYLGFYSAYEWCGQDRLYIMDEILNKAQIYANRHSNINPIYEQIKDESCFLEFAMHRLEEMGCEEIKDPKYINALNVYRNIMRNNEGIPMEIMNSNAPIEYRLIEEIMEMYREYSKDMVKEFSKVIDADLFIDEVDMINYKGSRRNV